MNDPQTFEDFRRFLQGAADQLATEMAAQQVNYLVPSGDVVALLKKTASVQGRSIWDEWESWALRHVLPIHRLVEISTCRDLTNSEREVMAKRLRDVLGYCILGLVLTEENE